MTTAREANPQNRRPTRLGKAIGLPFRAAAVIVGAMVTSVILEWLGMALGWWNQPGALHAQALLFSEVGWIDTEFTRSLLFSQPVETATVVLTLVYDTVFVQTGITAWFDPQAGTGGISATLAVYGQAAIYAVLVTLVRVLILILTLPLFVMAAFVAIVDGLVRRDLRRFGAGRESAFVYHHAKRLIGPIFITGWVVYLSVPFSLHPNFFLLPCAALFGLLLTITIGTFKKYL